VAAVERARVSIAPFGSLLGVAVGDRVEIADEALSCVLGYGALGRAFDAAGGALDQRGPVRGTRVKVARCAAPPPHERQPIDVPFWTGIRALDGLLTLGRGARVGFFGGPGAGKTTLLETIAAGARGDAVVLGLIGERGREAQTWLQRVDRRTTVVCATSDRSAAERVRAAEVALAHATALRRQGLHVVLILDSLARYAAALREERVALGEPVGRGGYPPSVRAELARFLEGAGNGARGSVTLLATVLSDGSDEREPLSDAARSLLDGHVVLASELARAGHHPAIDVLESASRTMSAVAGARHRLDAEALRAALALLHQTRDLRALGMAGEGLELGRAVAAEPAIHAFLRQREPSLPDETLRSLRSIASLLEPR
jgi:type III secretion protein N (ATPase)